MANAKEKLKQLQDLISKLKNVSKADSTPNQQNKVEQKETSAAIEICMHNINTWRVVFLSRIRSLSSLFSDKLLKSLPKKGLYLSSSLITISCDAINLYRLK